MPPEETRHDTNTDPLAGSRRPWHRSAWITLRDQPAPKRAIHCLQAPIVPALMSKIIGRMASKSVDQVGHGAAFEVVAECLQILLEERALTINLLVARVEHRQLGCADREASLGIFGIKRVRFAVTVLRFVVTVHRHETIAPIHQRIDMIGPYREGL